VSTRQTTDRYAFTVIQDDQAFVLVCPFGCPARFRGRKGQPKRFAHTHGAGYGWREPHCADLTGRGLIYLGPDPGRQGEAL
jgi:hypothetical protein